MKLSEYAVKNYQFTLILFVMIIALGLSTILNMPRSEDPETDNPMPACRHWFENPRSSNSRPSFHWLTARS